MLGTEESQNRIGSKIRVKEFFSRYMLYCLFLLLVLILSFSTDKFFTVTNIVSTLRQISIQSIIAVGMTMVIVLGQIDLSVGAIVAFASVVNALLMRGGMPIFPAIIITLILSSIWGLINGIVTAKLNIHAFLVTLAMMTVVRGVTYTLTGGYPVGDLPKQFYTLGAGHVGIIPLPVIYMIAIYIVGVFVLDRTPFGRSIYAIGGNAEAARLSGIKIEKIKIIVFTITSLLSGLAGIVLSSRLMAGSPETGVGWELDIVAAVIIGGTSMFGGEGKLTGTLMGMLFIGVLTNGMILLGVTPYMQQVIRGLVILIAVIMNSFQKE
ncbi:MAG: ABC transporter permease [Clostridia bacterium]|nr:ABC transporter permease [Clostridia bacterium]